MGHEGWRIAWLAVHTLPPGTALRQPVPPWCPDGHRVQIGAPALHPLPWLFPLSSAPSPRVAYMLLQSMMGHACRETINHKQSNAAGCWWPPVQGRVLAGWGCRLHYPPPTLPLGRIGSASP